MIISTVHRALSFAPVYRGFQLLFGADRARRKHVAVHIRPSPGDFVVDLGCGPGDILDYLPNVRYLGFDVNPAYIKAALSRYGSMGEFRMSSVNRAELTDLFGHVDIVMANGVVHHLDDEDAEHLFALASSLSEPRSRPPLAGVAGPASMCAHPSATWPLRGGTSRVCLSASTITCFDFPIAIL
jgi:cyclopropane fatty-acyl-phospholipid synthase-like methyltransferase